MKLRFLLSVLKIYLIPILGLLLFTLFYTACSEEESTNPPPPPPDSNTVLIQSSSFNPGTRTITAGTKVTWRNNDNIPHTVTSGTPGNSSGVFDSGSMAPGETFEHTFTQAGTFSYFCSIHTGMTASIVVQ